MESGGVRRLPPLAANDSYSGSSVGVSQARPAPNQHNELRTSFNGSRVVRRESVVRFGAGCGRQRSLPDPPAAHSGPRGAVFCEDGFERRQSVAHGARLRLSRNPGSASLWGTGVYDTTAFTKGGAYDWTNTW